MDTLVIRKSSERFMPTVSLCHGDGYIKENGEATVYAMVYINRRREGQMENSIALIEQSWYK